MARRSGLGGWTRRFRGNYFWARSTDALAEKFPVCSVDSRALNGTTIGERARNLGRLFRIDRQGAPRSIWRGTVGFASPAPKPGGTRASRLTDRQTSHR